MTATAWTKDRIDRLKALWRDGVTAELIARDLAHGITRSAVLGKVHRMGLSAGRTSSPTRKRQESGPGPATAARERIEAAALDQGRDVAPDVARASVLTVRRQECRWPIGDPRSPGFGLCGRARERGAYCHAHAGLAYRPVPGQSDNLEALAGLG